ncbi:MAG: isoprenylcysteine carboxylmethyltransferase family protein [Deltaproteobacteria bacterium]|nr:isoprenylcysteine carboxylmethyltransferase family protein [Deltaproteobacteria bacterium]
MRNKVIACSVGALCHTVFLLAISAMAYMLFYGLTRGLLPLQHFGRVTNAALLVQFPVFHSFFLSRRGRAILAAPFPKEIGANMQTTTFGLIASIQLLAVFLFWVPEGSIWYAPKGNLLVAWTVVYVASWLLLARALAEAGLAMQTGYLGWRSVVANQRPQYPKPRFEGLHRMCRHPIYLSFALVILTAPVWGVDHVMLALVWVTYCMVGPRLKEKRFLAYYGDEYERYRERTPYLIPRIPFLRAWTARR